MSKGKKKLQLSNRQKILGAQHCFANAKALFEEAEILYKESKWARSTALFILGTEEISKIELIGQTFSYKTVQEWSDFEKKFSSHNEKLKLADIISLQLKDRSDNASKLEEEVKEIKKGRNLNIGKQKCFYVGFSNVLGWEVPLRDVTKEDAKYCKEMLDSRIQAYNEIFSKPFNEIVDIIKEMKKIVASPEAMEKSIKLQNKIKKLFDKPETNR